MNNTQILDGIEAAVEFNEVLEQEAMSESGPLEKGSAANLTNTLIRTLQDSGANNEVVFAAVMQLSSRTMNQLASQIKQVSTKEN